MPGSDYTATFDDIELLVNQTCPIATPTSTATDTPEPLPTNTPVPASIPAQGPMGTGLLLLFLGWCLRRRRG